MFRICVMAAGLVVGVGISLAGASDSSLHTGYWKDSFADSDEYESFRCRIVDDRSEFIRVLRRAGWSRERIPRIDWDREQAVVISRRRSDMWFLGLEPDGEGELALRYSWENPDQAEPEPEPRGGSGVTFFFSTAPIRSIIVVSYGEFLPMRDAGYCSGRPRK